MPPKPSSLAGPVDGILGSTKQLMDMVAKGQTQNQGYKRKIEALNDTVAVLKEREALLA